MEAVWDDSTSLVGWYEPSNGAVYDASYNLRAVVQRGSLYTWQGDHRGYIVDGWFRDGDGRAVAFMRGARGGPITPITPTPPIPPLMPVPPIPAHHADRPDHAGRLAELVPTQFRRASQMSSPRADAMRPSSTGICPCTTGAVLYLNPPEAAVVLCVDEKSQVQALARSQPAFPMMPGMPEKRTHDYLRHGTTSLFAAFNTEDGTVISSLHRRHRAIEFKKFLQKINSQVPEHLDVHLICDNYGTHKSPAIRRWLDTHPRFHMHHTPTYSSWINQVERWFAYLTNDLLRRSDHRSVQALENDIRGWVSEWNKNPKPFIWTKTAEQILKSLSRLLQRINGAGH